MLKALIIDDEQPTLFMFNLFLEAYGYEVITAENAAAGIELFKKERPPIVFTDIKMPGMDGLDVLKILKSIDPAVQVIVMTGHGDQDLMRQAMELKATAFIHKPIDREVLEQVLKKAVDSLPQKE
ncbi:MAG: response regulator [Deltaproteobacteria bacterium]|nr:response regulator [Deltaproteobacteria bacterium]MBW2632734.1 response regulator [Deltaproteobacteria bacterium]